MADMDMAIFKQIGSRIKAARIQQKMSQAELAEKAHLCLPQISALELGKVKMNLATFIKLVEALQVSADSILRPDTPEGNSVYQSEFSELLSDCTAAEMESILKIVKELKITMHSKKITTISNRSDF